MNKVTRDDSKILVIDDESIIRDLLKRTLQEQGHDVETVENGEIALEKIKNTFFSILITDLKMPGVDGIDVLKNIKKINPYIEVIIVTGYPTIESAVEAIKRGAFDFICKPFDIKEIKSIVDRCRKKQKFTINHVELSELMALFEVGKTAIATVNLDSFLKQLLDAALRAIKAERGSILLLNEDTNELRIKAAYGLDEDIINNTRIKLNEGICGKVAQEGKPLLVVDINRDRRFHPKGSESRYKTNSFMSVSLASGHLNSRKDILGVINVTDKITGESFTKREQTILCVLAAQAAAAIENHRLYSQLQAKITVLNSTVKELNETQNQLIQTEKLAAMGELAFGIAHEIRNPLGIILGGVELLNNNLIKDEAIIKSSIEKIKHSVWRANNIIIDLLRFSRASDLKLESMDVRELMDEVISLITNQAYLNNVRIKKNYAQGMLYIKTDHAMLQQAFFNLCINAIQAMPRGGELSLNIVKGGDSGEVTIEIIDTGQGIPQEIMSKIFDPFFTTKEPGKGVGLGLSIVHMIVERHKGTIRVESKINQGTKFIIELPANNKAVFIDKTPPEIHRIDNGVRNGKPNGGEKKNTFN